MTFAADSPRQWCDPPSSFGRIDATRRAWRRPADGDPVGYTKFEAAVVQNAICVHVRRFKNDRGIAQEQLARDDERSDSLKAWNARLCGRRTMTLQDLAVLMRVIPGALPTEAEIQVFLDAARGRRDPQWNGPDTALDD